jgi:hypothetical protein
MKTNKLFGLSVLVFGLALSFTSCSNEDIPAGSQDKIISFENQALNTDGFWIGEVNENGVDDGWGGMTYPCSYTEDNFVVNTSYSVYYWSGFAISNRTETSYAALTQTPDQYNNVTGKAHSGKNFLIAQGAYNGESIKVKDGKTAVIKGLWYTNSAYSVNSILNGDNYSGPKFDNTDWFKCTVVGKKAGGSTVSVDIDLAKDGDYVKEWKYVDLSKLGEVNEISFQFSGSRTGAYGLNTPAYICIDDLVIEK